MPEENNLVSVIAENMFAHQPMKHEFYLPQRTNFLT